MISEEAKIDEVIRMLDRSCLVCSNDHDDYYNDSTNHVPSYYKAFCNKCVLECYKGGTRPPFTEWLEAEMQIRGLK